MWLFTFFELADNLGVDLKKAMESKLKSNEKRYPIDKIKGRDKKYTDI